MPKQLSRLLAIVILFTAGMLFSNSVKTWQSGDIVITSAAKDSSYARLMVRSLHQRINDFQMELGVYPARKLAIIILPNRTEYRKITAGKGKLVESSEAFYSPNEQFIYVRSPDQLGVQNFDDILMHEYIHWFLDETLANVPLWFHEGMAMYYSGQFNFDAYYNFTRYRFMGYRLSLSGMADHYPSDKSQWNMFYLTSAFAVNYLNSHHKTEWQKFWDVVGFNYNRLTNSDTLKVDFIQAFHVSYQMSLVALSQEYDRALKRYSWQFPLIGFNALVFALLPFIVIAGWHRSRRRMKALPDVIPEEDETDDNLDQEISSGDEPTIKKSESPDLPS